MGKLCCLAVDPALLEDQPLLANPGVGEALEEHDGESGGKMRRLCTFPSERHPARPLPSGRAAYGHRLKTRTWQVWSRPTEAPGPLAPPLMSTVHVQSRSSRLGPVHLNTANEGPVCDFETCFPFACLSLRYPFSILLSFLYHNAVSRKQNCNKLRENPKGPISLNDN